MATKQVDYGKLYEALPEQVHAWKVLCEDTPEWVNAAVRAGKVDFVRNKQDGTREFAKVKVVKDWRNALRGDYIVRGGNGFIYVMAESSFLKKHRFLRQDVY